MDDLTMHTIYKDPADYPSKVVIRKFIVKSGQIYATEDIVICNSIDEARDKVSKGKICLVRGENDHPSVIETWL